LEAEKINETRTEIRTETRTQLSPAAIYIMQDQSGSMMDRWGYAQQSITAFVTDSSSDGLYVALQYFPFSGPFCIPGFVQDCGGTAFAMPEVGWGVLGPPGTQNTAVTDNLLLHFPCGAGTPIEGALRGVTQGCLAFEQQNPGIECYALFITDGEPSGCAEDTATFTTIAAQALQNGVETYTVGMPGANFIQLDAIAQAGGTDCNGASSGLSCNASNGAEFLNALNAIRDTVTEVIETVVEIPVEISVPLDCEWEFPADENGDPAKVNVNFKESASNVATELVQVPAAADCERTQNGWYYDDPATPTKLVACDDVCNVVKVTPGTIDILVGCETKKAIFN
jgi:hypothetical protein